MSFFGHSKSVTCGQFSFDGKYLLTGSDDISVKIWDLKNQSLIHTVKSKRFHQAAICSLAAAKKKNIMATGSMDNELGFLNYENGNVLLYYYINIIIYYYNNILYYIIYRFLPYTMLGKKNTQSKLLNFATRINL